MINIVLFGAPGCGKGTQAQRLKAHYGIEHVSTGEVIRDEIRRGTELGRSMESYIKAGKLAPDEIVIGMVANYVSEHKHVKGCIFDGFPRTTVQAEEFDKLLARHGLKVDIMVDIHVPEEELVQRILLRGKDSGRADDRRRLGLLRRPGQIRLGQRHGFDGGGLLAHHRRDRPVAIGRRRPTAETRGKSCSGLHFHPLSRSRARAGTARFRLRRQTRPGTFPVFAAAVRTPGTDPGGGIGSKIRR